MTRANASTSTHSITNSGNATNTANAHNTVRFMPTAKPPQPLAFAPEPLHIQSKEPSLMSKLQTPDKEPTVRFTVDMSVGRAP
jgi:hypothetical protein